MSSSGSAIAANSEKTRRELSESPSKSPWPGPSRRLGQREYVAVGFVSTLALAESLRALVKSTYGLGKRMVRVTKMNDDDTYGLFVAEPLHEWERIPLDATRRALAEMCHR